MRLFLPVLIGLLASFGSYRAAAQCLPLATLSALSVEPIGDTPPAIVSQVLPGTEWQYRGLLSDTRELAWTSVTPKAATPTSRLSLRPTQQRYDVVLKTSVSGCVRQLRGELNARKIKPEPITCLNCEGQRYNLPEGGSVSFFSKMKGPYPLVVVLHPPAGTPAPKADITRTPAGQ